MSNLITLPGLIDCHVHFREPGFEHKATMRSEAASARAGGVLTVCDMPNTNPPCVTVEALRQKIDIADGITDCDIRFFFGITEREHLDELHVAWGDEQLRRRLCGVKLYLDHSTGNQKVEGGIVAEIFEACATFGVPLVAHCEDADINDQKQAELYQEGGPVALHSQMRPPESEATAIAYAIDLAERYGTQFHVAHLSTAQGVELVRQAKSRGATVSCEVTPHHLFLSTDDYDRLGTLGKMNPPLRSPEHGAALWQGIADGTVDCVATDHAPHTLEEKHIAPALTAPSGVPGVETALPLLLTRLHPEQVRTLMYDNPNRIFNLQASDAPRLTMDLDVEYHIRAEDLHSKCRWTPFEGMSAKGKVVEMAC